MTDYTSIIKPLVDLIATAPGQLGYIPENDILIIPLQQHSIDAKLVHRLSELTDLDIHSFLQDLSLAPEGLGPYVAFCDNCDEMHLAAFTPHAPIDIDTTWLTTNRDTEGYLDVLNEARSRIAHHIMNIYDTNDKNAMRETEFIAVIVNAELDAQLRAGDTAIIDRLKEADCSVLPTRPLFVLSLPEMLQSETVTLHYCDLRNEKLDTQLPITALLPSVIDTATMTAWRAEHNMELPLMGRNEVKTRFMPMSKEEFTADNAHAKQLRKLAAICIKDIATFQAHHRVMMEPVPNLQDDNDLTLTVLPVVGSRAMQPIFNMLNDAQFDTATLSATRIANEQLALNPEDLTPLVRILSVMLSDAGNAQPLKMRALTDIALMIASLPPVNNKHIPNVLLNSTIGDRQALTTWRAAAEIMVRIPWGVVCDGSNTAISASTAGSLRYGALAYLFSYYLVAATHRPNTTEVLALAEIIGDEFNDTLFNIWAKHILNSPLILTEVRKQIKTMFYDTAITLNAYALQRRIDTAEQTE